MSFNFYILKFYFPCSKPVAFKAFLMYTGHVPFYRRQAGVAELADALDLGSSGNTVQVQVLSPASKSSG